MSLLRTLGDAGDSPENTAGRTLLKTARLIDDRLYYSLNREWANYPARHTSGSITAGDNTGGLTVSLNATIKHKISLYIKDGYDDSTAHDISVQVSTDNSTWRTIKTINVTAAYEEVLSVESDADLKKGVGYQYWRITTTKASVTLTFELSAKGS